MPPTSHAGDAFGVFYWRRLRRLLLAMPSASHEGDAFRISAIPGAVNPFTLPWHRLYLGIDFDFDSGRRLGVAESLRSRPRHPRGISRMADGTFPHLTRS